jgi:hypothetical protein
VGLAAGGVAADVVAEQQEAADDVVELGRAQRDVLGLAVGDPCGPGAGQAVGLGLVLDAAAALGEAEPALHGVPELVRHHDRHQEPAVAGGELVEQGAVVGDQVARGVVVRVAGDLLGRGR